MYNVLIKSERAYWIFPTRLQKIGWQIAMQTLNSSLTLKGDKMKEKGLTFFNDLIEENLKEVMNKYGAKKTEKSFQIGYLKQALAWEMWQNQQKG